MYNRSALNGNKLKTVWVTGAGRSGTNLVGMMADGHPEVNVFPYELRLARQWIEATKWVQASEDGHIPGEILYQLLVRPHIHQPGFQKLGINETSFDRSRKMEFVFFEYIDYLNATIFSNQKTTFLYRAPGSQLDFYLDQARKSSAREGRALLMLRHPLQNYLSLLNHDLQKGLGYRSPAHVQPNVGLHTFLHMRLLGVLRAFQAANRFSGDERVTITRLEHFSADPEERKRVWAELRIPFHESLERLTRIGQLSLTSSGKLRTTALQPIGTEDYRPKLTETELATFQKCARLFKPFYEHVFESVDVVNNDKAEELFIQREVECLTKDRNARDKRKKRIRSITGMPATLRDAFTWPFRAADIIKNDILFYPQARIRRMTPSHKDLMDGFVEIPETFGII